MQIFYDAKPKLLEHSAIALGFFDGVHPGHQAVIGAAVQEAKSRGLISAVATFKDHPRAFLEGSPPLLLTTIEQRLSLFKELGMEAALILSFTKELCSLSAKQYVQNILVDALGADLISIGYNHHFGKDREGNPTLLSELGKSMNFAVEICPPVFINGIEVSSSKIREAIFAGNISLANQLLERPYAISGKVIKGAGRGKTIGFPTANICTQEFQIIPKQGVYAGQVKLDKNRMLPAVINIGTRPTFDQIKNAKPLIEVYIFDFNENIYDCTLEILFHKYLRSEQKFDSVDTLKKQISNDCQHAKEYLKSCT